MKWHWNIKRPTHKTTFGEMIDLPFPNEIDVVVVCVNAGRGYVPRCVLLPHQLYASNFDKLAAMGDGGIADEIVVFPLRSKDALCVAVREYIAKGATDEATKEEGDE